MSSNRCSTRWLALFLAASVFAACKKDTELATASPNASASAGLVVSPGTVLVTDEGFQPTRVSLKRGDKLVFRRTSESTCAKEVVFPELKLEKPLPLNTDVVIELPASATGELGFQCGMGMYQSKVVISPG